MRIRPSILTAAAATAATAAIAIAAPAALAASGSLTANVHHLDCGAQAVSAGSKDCPSITFTNTASTSVQLTVLAIQESNAVDFLFSSTTCTPASSLPPGQSCVVNLAFNPVSVGHRSANLVVSEGTFNTSATVGLVGRGTA
jgi:Cep192 domain 4